jgi:NADH:ubiquinone oxidoreductase subunit F (NADH-binding)
VTELLQTPAAWPKVLLPDSPPKKGAAAVAFPGLRKAIRELGPEGTIAVIAESRLRGLGGGGFPVADKWRAAAAVEGATARYVIANGYGADPASQTDRTLLERRPHAVVEGAAIAAVAIGAEDVIIAVRAEATEVIEALQDVVSAAYEAGMLGLDAVGSGRRLDVEVRTVQGAYLLGEETILIKALEGKRGQPEQRPPHPTSDGLWGQPTVVQNVQTLAAAAWIVEHGAATFRKAGTDEAPGTILLQVRGPKNAGVAEVPFGTPLRDIAKLGGTPGTGRKLKAVLVGGPSGGILPPDHLATPFTFEALREVGAHVGSGSVIVADDRACIVDLARLLTRYCADEACGKTIPCRIGTRRLAEISERLADGTSRANDLQLATDLAADIVGSGLCDHERLATLPMTTGLRYFRAEIDAHLERGVCPAGVCRPIGLALKQAGPARTANPAATAAPVAGATA